MPANVTPEYEKADRRFREASTDQEKLDALQEMLSTIPKHKGTEKMQADIKRRISQLRKAGAKKSVAKKGPDPFHIPKSGAGQVVLVGAPNVGKSALLAATTNAPVKVTEYPYATALPLPDDSRPGWERGRTRRACSGSSHRNTGPRGPIARPPSSDCRDCWPTR